MTTDIWIREWDAPIQVVESVTVVTTRIREAVPRSGFIAVTSDGAGEPDTIISVSSIQVVRKTPYGG